MAHERSEPQDSLPTSIPERARRLLRTWQSIRPHDTTTHQAFKDFSSRLAQESPEHLDATVAAAATLLKDMDLQAGFRRDVMARMALFDPLCSTSQPSRPTPLRIRSTQQEIEMTSKLKGSGGWLKESCARAGHGQLKCYGNLTSGPTMGPFRRRTDYV